MRAHFRRVVALKSVAAGSATWQSNSSRQHAQHAQHNANLTSSLAHIWFRRRRGNTCVALAKGVAGRGGGCGMARGKGRRGEGGKSAFCYAKRGDLFEDEPRQTCRQWGGGEEGVSNMTHFWAGRMRNWIYEYAYECAYYSHMREWSPTQHTQFALFCWWVQQTSPSPGGSTQNSQRATAVAALQRQSQSPDPATPHPSLSLCSPPSSPLYDFCARLFVVCCCSPCRRRVITKRIRSMHNK